MTSLSVCKKTSLSPKRCTATNNFNGTQLGNHGRPFRIRRNKLRTAPPSGYSTLISFPVCKKTSIYRKRSIIEVNILLNTYRKPYKPFIIPLLETVFSAPQRRYQDDVTFGAQENLIISEKVYIRRTNSMEDNQKIIGGLHECVIRNCVQRPPADLAP